MHLGPPIRIDATKILSRHELAAVLDDLHQRAPRSANTWLNLTLVRLSCCCGLRVMALLFWIIAIVVLSRDRGFPEPRVWQTYLLGIVLFFSGIGCLFVADAIHRHYADKGPHEIVPFKWPDQLRWPDPDEPVKPPAPTPDTAPESE